MGYHPNVASNLRISEDQKNYAILIKRKQCAWILHRRLNKLLKFIYAFLPCYAYKLHAYKEIVYWGIGAHTEGNAWLYSWSTCKCHLKDLMPGNLPANSCILTLPGNKLEIWPFPKPCSYRVPILYYPGVQSKIQQYERSSVLCF